MALETNTDLPSDGASRETPRTIRAHKGVPLAPEALYAFLATLDNHWLLTDRFVSLVSLHGPVESRTGGEIMIRGPLGLRRHASTWLDTDEPGLRLVGTALVGRRTTARVTWALTRIPDGTDVELIVSVIAAGLADRALLIVATPWLRRRLLGAIDRLEQQTVAERPAERDAPPAST